MLARIYSRLRILQLQIIHRNIAGILSLKKLHISHSVVHSLSPSILDLRSHRTLLRSSIPNIIKGNLITMRLDNDAFHELFNDELKTLINVFKKHDYELRIAGGAVRDLLSGVHSDDLDFATTATPDEMLALFEVEGIRTLNRRGEKHGTITCRINDKRPSLLPTLQENYEVTTLRIDVVTDGRHAEVQFTTDWQLDALRRDLTINSMFLGFDGTVYDYFDGMTDLKSKTVKFVGDSRSRIQEDYLRILRYFRFYGRIAEEKADHSVDTLKSIQENMQGLEGVSGERIWLEMRKIFTGRLGCRIINDIIKLGLCKYLGFPESPDHEIYNEVYKRAHNLSPLPITLATALLQTNKDMEVLHKRVKISNVELNSGLFIIENRDKVSDVKDLLKWTKDRLISDSGKDPKLKSKLVEFMKYIGEDQKIIDEFLDFIPPLFPLNGHHLIKAGVPKGRLMAQVMDTLRKRWSSENCSLNQESLLNLIPELIEQLRSQKR